jgi:hypothetical protein
LKREDMIIEKGISDIVGVFLDPIVVWPGGWEDTIPPWIKEAIQLERLIENVRALKEGDMTATDAEACAYCYTTFLCHVPDHDWVTIYQYLTTKVSEMHRKEVTIPEDMRVDTLNEEQMRDLRQLKDWIYRKRTERRLEKDRAERREKRKEEAEKAEERKKEQFAFDFAERR